MAISRKRISQCPNQVRPVNLCQKGDSANILQDVSLHSSIKGYNRALKFHVKKIMLRDPIQNKGKEKFAQSRQIFKKKNKKNIAQILNMG